jgi:hypothetical protein
MYLLGQTKVPRFAYGDGAKPGDFGYWRAPLKSAVQCGQRVALMSIEETQ